ncbi:MAG: AmmeMemoRadiSam system protein B [Acidimicrobiia bacterium]
MTTALIRPAAVAGIFYSDDPATLTRNIDQMLASVRTCPSSVDVGSTAPIALIVPHAGYIYSGPIAASAYAQLAPWRDQIARVVAIGPPHRVAVRGIALSSASGFATPLGTIGIDTAANAVLASHRSVYVDDMAHAPEHSLEVHLPFLQRVLGDRWQLVPILVGGVPTTVVADTLAELWGAPGTVVIVSTDLSHYHDNDTARRLDQVTASMIVSRAWEAIKADGACGAGAVRAALELCRRGGQRVELLDLRNSGDTAGPSDRVVGYGSFAVR